jgi:hypothetical protein
MKEWKAESEKWKSNGGTKISLKMGLVVPKRTLSCSFHQRRVKLSPSLFFETIAQLCSVLHENKKSYSSTRKTRFRGRNVVFLPVLDQVTERPFSACRTEPALKPAASGRQTVL